MNSRSPRRGERILPPPAAVPAPMFRATAAGRCPCRISAQFPVRSEPMSSKRSARQRSFPHGFRIAVHDAIIPNDSETDRGAVRMPGYVIGHRVGGPVLTRKSSRAVEIDAGKVSERCCRVKLHVGTALVLPAGRHRQTLGKSAGRRCNNKHRCRTLKQSRDVSSRPSR